jgi:hypothetical protein
MYIVQYRYFVAMHCTYIVGILYKSFSGLVWPPCLFVLVITHKFTVFPAGNLGNERVNISYISLRVFSHAGGPLRGGWGGGFWSRGKGVTDRLFRVLWWVASHRNQG